MINKDALISQVSLETGFTKKDIKVVLDSIFNTITNLIKDGETVSITNFGKFGTTIRAARTGRNPQTGDSISIPAMTVPCFRASETLKGLVK